MFRVSERTVRERLTAIRRQTRRRGSKAAAAPPEQAGSAPQHPRKLDPWEREFLEVLIHYPEHVPRARAEIDWRADGVWMTGPTAEVFEGRIAPGFAPGARP